MILSLLTVQTAPPKVQIGKGLREYGYLAKIDKLSGQAGLPNLRKMSLGGTDFEIRVWRFAEFAANPLSGRILRRRSMRYSGLEVDEPGGARRFLSSL